ncbi:MAG: PEP-CTERM sorting domain-containing protein [Deltaproteobacteria bacterium]|nr:PEP-CTERM sorting domain-containing protein [Deltaproteobacteria bacterium]
MPISIAVLRRILLPIGRPLALLLLLVAALASPSGARAEDVSVFGAPGAPGTTGLGNNGTPGGDGETVTATSGPTDPNNQARAFGGDGGIGGPGGGLSGSGGPGGAGGGANATATTQLGSGDAIATAIAEGGDGGRGGDRASTGAGGSGGVAGDANATAIATNTNGSANATARATGGAGGSGAGPGTVPTDGGLASASITAHGTRAVSGILEVSGGNGGSGAGGTAGSIGGQGASVEVGSAAVDLSASGSDAQYRLTVGASAGDGGGVNTAGRAGAGGDALVDLTQSGASGSLYSMSLRGEGGEGGATSLGGIVGRAGTSSVTGVLSFDGDASLGVLSRGGNGGSTSGGSARAGGTGGLASGDASVESLAPGANASAAVDLIGGRGGFASGRGGAGGSVVGSASATATPTGVATARLFATGGNGGAGVTLGGDGASIALVDTVAGSGGAVVLEQAAIGGKGGAVGPPSASTATGGRGGSASSTLVRSNAAGSLSLSSSARSGDGGDNGGQAGTSFASAVGEALGDVVVSATALSGSAGFTNGMVPTSGADGAAASLGPVRGVSTGGGAVDVFGSAQGGSGGDGSTRVGAGSDALLVDAVDGETSGTLRLRQDARAGHAGRPLASVAPGLGARGGDARSELVVAKQASKLDIVLEARAGDSRGRDAVGTAFAGGVATTAADLRNERGGIDALYRSIGGVGAGVVLQDLRNGTGGAAVSTLRATTTGDGQRITIRPNRDDRGSNFGSTGGAGGSADRFAPTAHDVGGDGGSSSTTVDGIALGDSEVDIEAVAAGGVGGQVGTNGTAGRGGDASAQATGSNAGASAVSVLAEARGGFGGGSSGFSGVTGGDGGGAQATAHGESSGGGDVTARARVIGGGTTVGQGADAVLVDSASGRTSGALRLVQEAIGGAQSFPSQPGRAGAGRSELSIDDTESRRLELESLGTGGSGRVAGSAHAAASGIGSGDVSVLARATGGAGSEGSAAEGASPTMGRVYGESRLGGLVRVVGELLGGAGAVGSSAGRGGSVAVVDAVDGATSGRLELVQRATGGDAGDGATFVDASPGAPGGSATNLLTRSLRTAELAVELSASGGTGSDGATGSGGATRGGDARAEAVTTNEIGSASLFVDANGGDGGSGLGGRVGGDGGAASLLASLRTLGEGDDIAIGGDDGLHRWGAVGGDARGFGASGPEGGHGGRATSRSLGTALGDSRVTVFDRAFGGRGFDGGAADSTAIATNAGGSPTVAAAFAEGGVSSSGGVGGDAIARASSQSGSGTSTADATADTNAPFRAFRAGDAPMAHALADAAGGLASATTRASGRTGALGTIGSFVDASARASGGRALSAEALVGADPALAFASTRNAASVSTGAHDFAGELGRFGLDLDASEAGPDIVLHAEVGLSIGSSTPLDGVFASIYALRVDSADFANLAFRIFAGDALVLAQDFSDSASARHFFASPIDLEALVSRLPNGDASRLVFSLEGSGGPADAGFGMLFSVGTTIVPEPGTALLLGLGLALLGAKRGPARLSHRLKERKR